MRAHLIMCNFGIYIQCKESVKKQNTNRLLGRKIGLIENIVLFLFGNGVRM